MQELLISDFPEKVIDGLSDVRFGKGVKLDVDAMKAIGRGEAAGFVTTNEFRASMAANYSTLGTLLASKESFSEAEAAFHRAVDIFDDLEHTTTSSDFTEFMTSNPSEKSFFDNLLKSDPKHEQYILAKSMGYLNLGQMLVTAERNEAAEDAFNHAKQAYENAGRSLQDSPDGRHLHALIHVGIGRVRIAQSRFAESIDELNQAIDLESQLYKEFPSVLNYYSTIASTRLIQCVPFVESDEPTKGEESWLVAVQMHVALSNAYGKDNNRLFVETRTAMVHLTSLYASKNKLAEAAKAAETLRSLWPESDFNLYCVACCYAQCVLAEALHPAGDNDPKKASKSEYTDLAVKALTDSVERGFRRLDFIEQDQHLAPVRDDPRYKELVKRLKTKMTEEETSKGPYEETAVPVTK